MSRKIDSCVSRRTSFPFMNSPTNSTRLTQYNDEKKKKEFVKKKIYRNNGKKKKKYSKTKTYRMKMCAHDGAIFTRRTQPIGPLDLTQSHNSKVTALFICIYVSRDGLYLYPKNQHFMRTLCPAPTTPFKYLFPEKKIKLCSKKNK